MQDINCWLHTSDPFSKVILLRLCTGKRQNVLTSQAFYELARIIDYYYAHPPKGIVIASDKEESFCAGADLLEMYAFIGKPDGAAKLLEDIHGLCLKMVRAPFPIVAAISGECLGGGLELALACGLRVAASHPRTRFGLPEPTLGLIPGFGGTQLLPRQIGLQKALEIIVNQKPLMPKTISVKEAKNMGLVDRIVDPENLVSSAIDEIKKGLSPRKSASKKGLEKIPVLGPKIILSMARKRVLRETKGNYPGHPAVIKALGSFAEPLEKGLRLEGELFLECLASSEAKNLIDIFFMRQNARSRQSLIASGSSLPAKVGVLGAGVMGRDIAYALLVNDIPVFLHDASSDALHGAILHIESLFEKGVARQRFTLAEAREKLGRFSWNWGESLQGFASADLILEAVSENEALKMRLLKSLGSIIGPDAVVVTNTSSLLPGRLAKALSRPDKFCAMHFFNPAYTMELIEITSCPETSEETLKRVAALANALNKTSVVLNKECALFIVNRILAHYFLESLNAVLQGRVHPLDLDLAFEQFGMAAGPFKTLDMAGFNTVQSIYEIVGEAYPGKFARLPEGFSLTKDPALLGQKTQKGFYLWKDARSLGFNNAIMARFSLGVSAAKLTQSATEIRDTILTIMANEAYELLNEGICSSETTIDLALILGSGFAPNHRGLLGWVAGKK